MLRSQIGMLFGAVIIGFASPTSLAGFSRLRISVGAWVLLGLCTVLLLTGMSKIDAGLYESARIDGATAWQEFRAHG